ncbi:MAG TPA: periplasmic heavy metal sensor [Aliidongia sp.]|nr:periplasmic heavy metal sensor [Aliidongia sp.]
MFGKKTLTVAFCAALLSMAAAAQEQGPGPGPGGWHHHGGPRGELAFLHGITLTDAQQTQIHEIVKASRTQMKPTAQQLRALHTQIREQLEGTGAINSGQLTTLQQQASALRDQIDAARLNTAIQIRAVLTPAQIAQAAQLHQQLTSLHEQERTLMEQAHPQSGATAQ